DISYCYCTINRDAREPRRCQAPRSPFMSGLRLPGLRVYVNFMTALRASRRVNVRLALRGAGRIGRIAALAFHEAAGPERILAVAARDIEHEGRRAQPGVASAQRAHEILSLRETRAQMRGAAREIALVQVVGLDAALDQGAHQRAEGRCVVVDAAQQH